MSKTLYTRLIEIAHYASKFKGVISLLSPLYYPVKTFLIARKNRKFRCNAMSVFTDMINCLNSNNVSYTLAFGTLLGAMREHGFIKHDLDIDLAMWKDERPENLTQLLCESGFKLQHSFKIENGDWGLEETYVKNGVHIDIFYFYPSIEKYPYCCDFTAFGECASFSSSMKRYGRVQARRIELPMCRERMIVKFENISVYVPNNAHQLLSFRYGDDYMIPNKKWCGYNEHIHEWMDVKAVYETF